jgi:hypothetical protein
VVEGEKRKEFYKNEEIHALFSFSYRFLTNTANLGHNVTKEIDEIGKRVILKQISLLSSDSQFVKSVSFCTYSISTMQSCHLRNKDEERNFIRCMQSFNISV